MVRAAVLPTTPNQPIYVCDTPVVTPVAASTSSVQLMGADDGRIHGQVFNNSTSVLYLKWGEGASSTSFTTKVPPQGLYELPRYNAFVGLVTGAWATASGWALVTVAS